MKKKAIYQIINGKGENRRFDRRHLFLGLFTFMMVATFSFFYTSGMKAANAVDLSGFKAGNIMSDAVMRNYTSMTESEIQSFLNKKNSCGKKVSSVSGMKKASGKSFGISYQYTYSYSGTTYYYHVEDGKFVCLNNEKFDGETAAHIIYQAAQDYKINPQVLIVLLQKEQGLITDQWPNINHQYRSATGYGCPDTAACDSKYYGFKNQVRKAAELFDIVLSGNSKYYPIGNNNIRWSPKASCGSSKVYIENYATSALYRYTPYQPNAAALRAGYGTGDGCSAYGNRNFYAYFTDWFGSTQKVQYTFAQNYYNQNKKTTGKLTGETSCKTADNKTADLGKDGTYYCSQPFENGTLFWLTKVINKVRTDSNAQFLNTASAELYQGVSVKDRESLGAVIGSVSTIKDGSTSYQILPFEKGFIKKAGSKITIETDAMFSYWAKNKSSLGDITAAKATTTSTKTSYLTCKNGYLVTTDSKTYYIMPKTIFEVWTRGNNEKIMGKVTEPVGGNARTNIQWQGFENGYIMGNISKGFYPSTGKIREIWRKYKFESGSLGFILSDIKENKAGVEYQKYQGGYVIGTKKYGYFKISNRIAESWLKNDELMGAPTENAGGNGRTKINWQGFENGYIMGNDSKGYYPSTGKIREVWRKYKFESGSLGFILSDIKETKGGYTYQKYQGGYIVGTDKTGYQKMDTKIFEAWIRGDNEKLMGAPTSEVGGNGRTNLNWLGFKNG